MHYNKPYAELSQDTMRLLMDYDWPGNVRELENLIKRTVVFGTEAEIRKEITHGIAMAQRVQPPIDTRQPPASRGGAAVPPAPPVTDTPDASEAGTCSLKDVSRTAARSAERELILKMLQQTRWNRKETAEMLGISYKALLYKIKENGLDKAS